VQTLAPGVSFLDLNFQGYSRIIATAVLTGPDGVAIIDPGPSSTLPRLAAVLADAGIAMTDVSAIVLTHIHLDHAGASGTLVREHPRLPVYVHERGAPHLVDPSKLLASASRLYGDAMDTLWGEVAPVPASAIKPLRGGEVLPLAGETLSVVYTPGHASHHVSYFSRAGVAFVGDTAGVKLRPGGFVLPPTPPPDVDLDLWSESLAAIDAMKPETLFLTHFGPSSPREQHLTDMRTHLEVVSGLAKQSLDRPESDEDREAWFAGEVRRYLEGAGELEGDFYETAARFDLNWRGLARYWRKRAV
jgi:glyoxylase-like metal-dependent hydrolase (beta-lactamase superfamily II)